MTLSEFLLARYADDEEMAWRFTGWSKEFVLADVEAKRRIVDLHSPNDLYRNGSVTICSACGDLDAWPINHPCDTLRLLALPYADHPDYLDEWKP